MGHNHLKTSEASRYVNHHKRKYKDGTNPIPSWMLFQPGTKNFYESDKEWELPHMARPQQSTAVKASDSQNCSILGHIDQ